MLEHLFRHFKIGDHTVLHRADGNTIARRAAKHLFGIAANGLPGAIRVIPFDAAGSYLIRKLEGGPNITGGQMPEGALPLPAATIRIVRDWINQGANNN